MDLLTAQSEPVTVADLASLSGQHHNTVREHLDALTTAGLAESSTRRAQGRGRPALLYRAVPLERARPHLREHARLAAAMAAHLSRTSADPAAEARELGRHWGFDLAVELRAVSADGGGGPARRVLRMLAVLGYDPRPDGSRTVLRQCPVLDVARQFPDVVCQIHLGVIEGLYEMTGSASQGLELEAFAEPAGCRLTLPRLSESAGYA